MTYNGAHLGRRCLFDTSKSLLWLGFILFATVSIRAQAAFPAESLHLQAVIDGIDELHLSSTGAKWVHKNAAWPTDVQINGQAWSPQATPTWSPGVRLLPEDLDLCGAVLHVLRGRGSVKLGRDAEGLIITIDDPDGGADTYEVTVDFASVLTHKQTAKEPAGDLEFRVRATIDGMDDVTFARQEAIWNHTGETAATNVTLNGKAWDTQTHQPLPVPLLPESMDLQRASLQVLHGRQVTTLDYRQETLCLAFEDYAPGADLYDAIVKIPRFHDRSLILVHADLPNILSGAALRIYRFPEGNEARTVLAGQRVFDDKGHCLAALEPGQYQFEVLHSTGEEVVALKTDKLTIAGPTNIDLMPIREDFEFFGPGNQSMALEDLSIRSSRPGGDVSWKANSNVSKPLLILSKGQKYKIHAFGHQGSNYAALWKVVSADDLHKITLEPSQWTQFSFQWREGTPLAVRKGVKLDFPDGEMRIPDADTAHFFTNRRFFNVQYWLDFEGGRTAMFQSQGRLVLGKGTQLITFGGPMKAVASAAILQKDKDGEPKQDLWWEITLSDAQNYLLDVNASHIDWQQKLSRQNGSVIPAYPLSADDIKTLGNLSDTLVASATYKLEKAERVAAKPQPFVARRFRRLSTEVPPYHYWNTMAYLSKMERELSLIYIVRRLAPEGNRNIHLGWWENGGGVGGGNSVTLPVWEYTGCTSWYNHPWAIAHEMLHCFGFGHTHEMTRVDQEIQDRMEYYRWSVADHPEYAPEDWTELTAR